MVKRNNEQKVLFEIEEKIMRINKENQDLTLTIIKHKNKLDLNKYTLSSLHKRRELISNRI